MEALMKPFIAIYHLVSKVLSYPSNFISKSKSSIEEGIEDARLNSNKNKNSLNTSSNNGEENIIQQDNFVGIAKNKKK